MFKNRRDAGVLLASRLKELLLEHFVNSQDVIAVGLPRGGVPIASEISLALNCPIDVLVSKKIRAPDNPELAIGAVCSGGMIVLNERIEHSHFYRQAQEEQIKQLIALTEAQEINWRQKAGIPAAIDWTGKLVILVDDGIATGMTTAAALGRARQLGPKAVWLAAPVIPADTFEQLANCDQIVALSIPSEFQSVGSFYNDFHQLEDEEVLASLRQAYAQWQAKAVD